MRRIAVINQKGGVGKTTTTTNLGAALAEQGRRVVLVDMDPQANLSLHVDFEIPSEEPSIYTLLSGDTSFAATLRDTRTPGLRVVPANIELSGAELELASAMGREMLLREALEDWIAAERAQSGRDPADYVLFDCPPSLGLLSINALAAATEVLVTVQTEFLALQGMSKLMDVVALLRRKLNPGLEIAGIVPCLYDSRLRLAREVLAEIRRFFPGQVMREAIRANVKLAEAPSFGQTILQYAPESKGAYDHRRLALAILEQEARYPSMAGLPRPRPMEQLPTSSADAAPRPAGLPGAREAGPDPLDEVIEALSALPEAEMLEIELTPQRQGHPPSGFPDQRRPQPGRQGPGAPDAAGAPEAAAEAADMPGAADLLGAGEAFSASSLPPSAIEDELRTLGSAPASGSLPGPTQR
jgi:chromosome partitioning protein